MLLGSGRDRVHLSVVEQPHRGYSLLNVGLPEVQLLVQLDLILIRIFRKNGIRAVNWDS